MRVTKADLEREVQVTHKANGRLYAKLEELKREFEALTEDRDFLRGITMGLTSAAPHGEYNPKWQHGGRS